MTSKKQLTVWLKVVLASVYISFTLVFIRFFSFGESPTAWDHLYLSVALMFMVWVLRDIRQKRIDSK